VRACVCVRVCVCACVCVRVCVEIRAGPGDRKRVVGCPHALLGRIDLELKAGLGTMLESAVYPGPPSLHANLETQHTNLYRYEDGGSSGRSRKG
jgi:hypothetical protein